MPDNLVDHHSRIEDVSPQTQNLQEGISISLLASESLSLISAIAVKKLYSLYNNITIKINYKGKINLNISKIDSKLALETIV